MKELTIAMKKLHSPNSRAKKTEKKQEHTNKSDKRQNTNLHASNVLYTHTNATKSVSGKCPIIHTYFQYIYY